MKVFLLKQDDWNKPLINKKQTEVSNGIKARRIYDRFSNSE